MPETELQMAQRHVDQDEQLVTKQEELIGRLRSEGQTLEQAETLLATLRHTLQLAREHVARLEADAAEAWPAEAPPKPPQLDHEPPNKEIGGDGGNY